MTKLAMSVENVGVRFRPYVDRKPTLRRSIVQFNRRLLGEVVALDDVSFQVKRGEAFGVIGHNGAGKSTLLRVLAGTLKPNSGKVLTWGKTSTLLQLGLGFNPQLSGRRNIYLGSLAGGLRKKEVDQLYDRIVEYSELGDAIDRPMKTYSSGMFSKLAFSVAMHLDPGILLLDEILGVGDEAFRDRSMTAMDNLLERSGTIIFVSHNLPKVAEFCDRAMWLDHGRLQAVGPAEEIVARYVESVRSGD